MSLVRVAAVGAGYFSQFHYHGWRNIEGAACIALADRDLSKAREMAQRFDVPQVYEHVDAMLDELRPDLLDVITPPGTQDKLVEAAIERGIPVICQKPFGKNTADALAMTELAERAGVPLVIHENFRWQPWYREAKRMIETGQLGTLHSVAFRLRPGDGQGPRAYLDRQPYFQAMPRFLVCLLYTSDAADDLQPV